jgi:hypothetical protein
MKEIVSVAGNGGSSGDIATRRLAELQDRVSHLSNRLPELRQQLAAIDAESVNAHDVEATLHEFDPLWEQLSTSPVASRLVLSGFIQVGRTGHLRFPIEAESGSLALRLACSPHKSASPIAGTRAHSATC